MKWQGPGNIDNTGPKLALTESVFGFFRIRMVPWKLS